MGVLAAVREWFRPLDPSAFATFESAVLPATPGDIAQVDSLPVSVAQAFGINVTTTQVTRAQAMCLPAVRRARSLVAASVGEMPLRSVRTDPSASRTAAPGVEVVRRPLLEQPERDFARPTTLTWTVDDLVFYGVSWWYIVDRDAQGYPLAVERIDPARVSVHLPQRLPSGSPLAPAGSVRIDGVPVRDSDVLRFDGPDEGVLATASPVLRVGLDLLTATRALSTSVPPMVVLRDTRADGDPLTSAEAVSLAESFEAARRVRGTAYVPPNLALEVPQWDPQRLGLTEAREQLALDLARAFNLPASWLAAPDSSTLTYRNARDQRTELVDLTLAPFMSAVAGRLSMGDVTPRGQRVEFDTTRFLDGTRRDRIDDAAAAVAAGLMTADEARQTLLGLPGPAPTRQEAP